MSSTTEKLPTVEQIARITEEAPKSSRIMIWPTETELDEL